MLNRAANESVTDRFSSLSNCVSHSLTIWNHPGSDTNFLLNTEKSLPIGVSSFDFIPATRAIFLVFTKIDRECGFSLSTRRPKVEANWRGISERKSRGRSTSPLLQAERFFR